MGFTTTHINKSLNDIFAVGNVIHLLSAVPDSETSTSVTRVSGASYSGYTIKDGDFSINGTVVQSTNHLIFYICNELEGHGEAVGFGVYVEGTSLEYWGKFDTTMPITYNTCPTIKKYDATANDGAGEGLYISATSTSTKLSNTTE